MAIVSGYQKMKDYIKQSSGYKLISRWANANTLECDDGKTLQSKVGGISGISSSLTANSTTQAASTNLTNQLYQNIQNKATINGNVKFNNISVGNSDIALVYSIDDNVNFRYKEANGSQNWTNISDIVSSINNLRSSFQDGCNAIYNQCVTTGITPSSNSPDAICAAITAISNTAYTNGYNAGKNNPTSSGTYKISFSGKMHPPGDGSNWINVSDAIYIRVTGSSVVIDTNYISLANGQVDLNVAKV